MQADRDVLSVATDQLLHRVRQWKDAAPGAAKDVALVQLKDAFHHSGLQPWEYQNMMRRTSEYGLAEDPQPLWAEVRGSAGPEAGHVAAASPGRMQQRRAPARCAAGVRANL